MLTLSKCEGSGGRIKGTPEGFVVKEITANGTVLVPGRSYACGELGYANAESGRFSTFVMQKTNWNTIQALLRISKLLGHGKGAIGYCGVKDRTSVSVQLASIFGAKPQDLLRLRIKDISINGAWLSTGPVEMGSNLGNAFEIAVEDIKSPQSVGKAIEELGGSMPNYFDRQRFGSRLNNAKIGIAIIGGDFEAAAMHVLLDTDWEEDRIAVEARRQLASDRDFAKALSYFPGYLKGERSVLAHLSTHSKDYAGALRKLPRGITIMFIHAVEALVFNMALEARIRGADFNCPASCGSNFYGFPDTTAISAHGEYGLSPLIGYQTDESHITSYESNAMGKIGVSKEDFKIKGMPELSMKGALRPLLAPVKDIAYSFDHGTKVSFSIPAGSYATVFMNEITKRDDLNLERLR